LPKQTTGWPEPLWSRDAKELLSRSPKNVHYFFVPNGYTAEQIDLALTMIKGQIDGALAEMGEADQSWWADRIHYVNNTATLLGGWIGPLMSNPGWGVAIDRFQRIRFIGSYGDLNRWDEGRGWFAPNLSMAANEPVYYNYEAEREQRLGAQNALIVNAFPGDAFSGDGFVDVELPSVETLANYDSMDFDLYLGCDGEGEYGTCPAWDYLVYLYLCDKDDSEVCNTEIGRWITTYHREGRWVHDVSGMLPLLKEGGTRRFKFVTQQRYEVKLDLRFYSKSKEATPHQSVLLFSGGTFNAEYNDRHEPQTLMIPSDAKKVELATVITGHGMSDPHNCAEFCDASHHFAVNGKEVIHSFPEAGTSIDCMEKASSGTVPNQYGTWWYGRSGWCPGREVPMVMTDITQDINIGEENTFTYNAYFQGAPFTVGGAYMRVKAWVVISK